MVVSGESVLQAGRRRTVSNARDTGRESEIGFIFSDLDFFSLLKDTKEYGLQHEF